MRLVAKGATSQIEMFEVLDSTSTTGARKTGLVFNTASLTVYYTRAGAAATAITLVTQTVTGAWTSGGFVEVSSANAPGLYRVDVPDAAYATGVDSVVVTIKGATGMVQVSKEIMLIGANLQDTVRAGLTALPNAAAGANGGLPTGDANARVDVIKIAGTTQTARDLGTSVLLSSGTGTGQLDFTSGVVKANLAQILGTAITETAGQIAAGFKKLFDVATPVLTAASVNQTGDNYARLGAPAGASVSADVASIKTDTGTTIPGRLPTALVSGRIDASVGAIAANAITAASMAADASAEIADQVWDEVLSGHLTAGTTGAGLNAAGSAGDPWSTALPGAYGAGSAGKIVGDNINATISSRATPAQILTTPANLLATDGTGRVTVGTVSDKTGYSLSGAGVQAIWDALTSALTTVGSVGKRIADNLDATVSSRLASASYTAPDNADVATILGLVDTEITDIRNRLPAALVSGRMDVSVGAMAANTMTAAAAAADLTTELQGGLATSAALSSVATDVSTTLAAVDTEVAAIKAKTDNLPAAPAAVSDIPTANANADALLDRAAGVETNRTPRQALRLMLAVLAGKASGMATTTAVFRDTNDSKDRVTASVDSSGNRSAVTLDSS